MSLRRLAAGVVITLMSTSGAFAALSSQMQEWGKGPASYFMTKDDLAKWKTLKTDEEAQAFIDLFWARRDPTPGTPANEFQQRFDILVKQADDKYKFQKTRGAMTDRGKVLIALGPPSKLTKSRPETISNIQSGFIGEGQAASPQTDNYPTEAWIWEKEKIPSFAPGKQIVEVPFVDRYSSGDYKIGQSGSTNIIDLLKRAADASVVSTNLTEVPKTSAPAQAPVVQPAASAAAPAPAAAPVTTTFTTPEYKAAVDEFKAAKTNPYKTPSYVTYGEFITPGGEYFVPVQLFVPKSAAIPAGAKTTFFAVVEDDKGNVVRVYEEPVVLAATKEDLYFDKSLELPAGKYATVVGLAVDGKPVSMSSTKMELAALDKGSAGTSRLILSNDISAMKQAQLPTDPYAFGGIKVVPRGDRLFSTADELWYFFEMRNPGLNDTGEPKLQVKLDIEGTTTADKKKVKKQAPLMEAIAEPLKGVPGHFGVGSSIPLEKFAPGDYTLKLKVIDTVSKQNYNMEQDFKVR